VTATSILSHVYLDPTNDRWSGFKIERDRLLRFIAAEGIKGVYFLTGDLHTAHAISAQAVDKDGPPVPVWEFCASPFEQKPFWRALFFDRPARSPALQKQERHFVVPHINYGLVEVEFSASTRPVVHFQVVYREGDEWKRQFVNSTA
jgi:phosphodiesterase/alkaline phosphatase D-like protein